MTPEEAISGLRDFLKDIERFPSDDTFRCELDRESVEAILAAVTAAPDRKVIVDLVIERAEQACRYALKHQNFGKDEDTEYVSGWTVSAEVCEKAIRPQVERHISEDIARAVNNLKKPV